MWEKRQANAGKIPRVKKIGIARSAFILRSLIFFTNAWVFLNGMYVREIELVDHVKFASSALFELADQKGV